MDEVRALSIVSALANGVNPQTGEVFAADSPFQSAQIVRALYVAARALQAQPAARRRADAPANAGKPWTEAADVELLSAFDRGVAPTNIAQALGRTLAGIQARLEKHGRLQPQHEHLSGYRRFSARGGADSSNERSPA